MYTVCSYTMPSIHLTISFLHNLFLYPFPEKKMLALAKWKAFADDNFSAAHKVQFSMIG